jgi:hypothetical protein
VGVVGLHPLTIDELDDFGNYDIEIDKLGGLLTEAVKSFNHEHLPIDSSEKAHYEPLVVFLNACVDACRVVYHKSFYEFLNFIVFDTATQDRVLGAFPLKPDGAGSNGLRKDETRLWWRPKSGHRRSTMEIPVEVKGSWRELVSQAGTHARALMTARPLRQFSLVIAYNHACQELRFLVFHAGGLTSSRALRPNQRGDHKDILRLFLALLTWETPGDAGLPEWSNDVEMFIQRGEDDQNGLRMQVTETLYQRHGIRGRGPQVSCLSAIEDPELLPGSAPVVTTTTLRRSNRIAEQARKNAEGSSQRHGARSVHRKPFTNFTNTR